jgi:hypothetical protein
VLQRRRCKRGESDDVLMVMNNGAIPNKGLVSMTLASVCLRVFSFEELDLQRSDDGSVGGKFGG